MPDQRPQSTGIASPVIMLLSAAIFGYFGFFIGLTNQGPSGEVVFMFTLLLWTLRVGAIAFAASALIAFVQPTAGELMYCLSSLATALGLAAVGVLDIMDQQYAAAIPPILAFIFAAWNGFSAWAGLQAILGRPAPRPVP